MIPRRPGRCTGTVPAVLVAGLGLLGCSSGSSPNADPPPLTVEFSGCRTVARGPRCTPRETRRLRLWVHTAPEVELLIDGEPPPAPGQAIQGGRRFEVEAKAGAREITVEARRGDAAGGSIWRLALGGTVQPWQRRVSELSRRGDWEAIRKLAETHLGSPSPAEQGAALSVLARLSIASGQRERAESELRQALGAHRRAGADFEEVRDATALVWLLQERRAFSAARRVLDGLPPPAGHAEAAYLGAYHRGLLAVETGDLRNGLRHLGEAVAQADRLGLERRRILAEEVQVRELQRIGRLDDGEAAGRFSRLAAEAEAAGLSACDRAQLLNNQAWSLLVAREAGRTAHDPMPALLDALRSFEEGCPGLIQERLNLRLNLALAHLQEGRPERARELLAETRRLEDEPVGNRLLWWLDVEARILLAEGRAGLALGLYEELAERSRQTLAPEAEWRAAFGRARALVAMGERSRALAAFETAERLLDQEILWVSMDEGRATFAAQRQRATRLYLELLLDGDRPEEALRVVRRSRSRLLATLHHLVLLSRLSAAERQRWNRAVAAYRQGREEVDRAAAESWRLPGPAHEQALERGVRQLRDLRRQLDLLLAQLHRGMPSSAWAPVPPPAGVVLLAYHPLPQGWVGLAADSRGVVARRLGALDELLGELSEPSTKRRRELAAHLLTPFAAAIARARQVRVLPWGGLRQVDFHTLPFRGESLLASHQVAWALDLPSHPAATERPARALLVADPAGDLPGSRAEAEAVEAALHSSPRAWKMSALLGRQASGSEVRRLLSGSDLFHYAGHAIFAGWDSALPLAEESRLTLGDVLALEPAPAWVVLSGCETGRSSSEAPEETIGLAHAFVAAGSSAVVAAVRPVSDREAAALLATFYDELAAGTDVVEALRRAQREQRQRGSGSAWQSFRVFLP